MMNTVSVLRVLYPSSGGLGLTTDWDAVCWRSEGRQLIDYVSTAFAAHCVEGRQLLSSGSGLVPKLCPADGVQWESGRK